MAEKKEFIDVIEEYAESLLKSSGSMSSMIESIYEEIYGEILKKMVDDYRNQNES